MNTPRVVKNLRNMEIDEISLVNRGANQHATVSIAKNAPEEENMANELYTEDGDLLDESNAVEGATVYDADMNEYTLEAEEANEGENENENEKEFAEVGKSAFFQPQQNSGSFQDAVREELSKAYSDEDRDKVFSKAMGYIEELEGKQEESASIAKSERDLRLTREYISKAADYGLPIADEELGPVLYRMAENMPFDDCAVIAKALETAGSIIFDEIGAKGGGANSDIMDTVNGYADEYVGKAEDGFSKAEATTGIFDSNPDAYEQYLADRNVR